MLDIMHVT